MRSPPYLYVYSITRKDIFVNKKTLKILDSRKISIPKNWSMWLCVGLINWKKLHRDKNGQNGRE